MVDRKLKVGFICVHNACRSQIAQALGTLLASDVFESYSAGSVIKPHINQDANRIMKELYQIDMEATQYSKLVSELPQMDIIITMGCHVTCPMIPCIYQEDWGLIDPSGEADEVYKAVIEQIHSKIVKLKEQIEKGVFSSES